MSKEAARMIGQMAQMIKERDDRITELEAAARMALKLIEENLYMPNPIVAETVAALREALGVPKP